MNFNYPEGMDEWKPTPTVLTDISRRLLEAQEQESGRIARGLHEDVGQELVLCAAKVEKIDKLLPDSAIEAQRRTQELRENASKVLSAVQSLRDQLHPPKLEYLGLAAAMRSLCREFTKQHNLPVDFIEAGLPRTTPHEISICLFRVLQEALSNIANHSGAPFAEVKLQGSPSEIRLLIRDSGVGFDPEAAGNGECLGLIGMRERVHVVKGTISIRSKPQFGTEISVRVRLQTGTTIQASPAGK